MGNGTSSSQLSIWQKMVLAARLSSSLYEAVEADPGANGQAFLVVLLASLASGIGTGLRGLIERGPVWFLWSLVIGLSLAIVGWLLWAFLTYWIGKTLFRGPQTEVTYGQMLRTLGFASSAGMLRIFAFIPFLGGFIELVAAIWVLVAGVIAVRQALDFSTGRAIGTVLVGWLVYILVLVLASILLLGQRGFV